MVDLFAHPAAYEKLMGRWSAKLSPLFTRFAQVRDGGRILDVGCGTGALVHWLTDATQHTVIVGIDSSRTFIECTRARFTGPRYSFDVGDAMALPYASHSFDQALSLLVFQFIPQPDRAASEMCRATRPGGTVAACTWDTGGGGLEMSRIFWEEAIGLDPGAEKSQQRSLCCNRSGQLAALWQAAGLESVEEVKLQMETAFSRFEDYWQPYTRGAGPQGAYVDSLSPARRSALRQALRTRLLGDQADGPLTLRARALAVRGTVPA